MSDRDIAEELRRHARKIGDPAGDTPAVMHQAADEIYCLRAANEAFGKRQDWWSERMFALEHERDRLRAALSAAAVPDGWRLVPVEPTPEMIGEIESASRIGAVWTAASIYAAMLAAAPKPPAAQQGEHLLQDQDRGLSQWLASQPDARLHAREAAAAIVAQQGEAVAPDDDHPTLRGCIETIKQAHDESLEGEHASARVMLRDVVADLEQIATQPAAAPQPVAQGEELTTLMAALKGYFAAADAAWLETVAEARKLGLRSLPIGADGAKALEKFDELRKCFNALAAAPPARQALTDERIAAMRQAGYLDADDYPDAWAYERGVRDAERAHGIGGKECAA